MNGRFKVAIVAGTLLACSAPAPKKKEIPEIPSDEVTLVRPMNSTASERVKTKPSSSGEPDVAEFIGKANPQGTRAATYKTWEEYQFEHRYDCAGALDRISSPHVIFLGERRATIWGYRMVVRQADASEPPTGIKLGVMSAPKDSSAATAANINAFLEWFSQEGVDAVVVNGDVGYTGDEIEGTFEILAKSGQLVIVSAGNADPNGAFNRAARTISEKHPNLVNGNLVRLIEFGPISLLTLPGYHDPHFITQGVGCQYYPSDIAALKRLVPEAEGNVVLVAHGPPQGKGRNAVDYAYDAGNVGDPNLTKFMQKQNISVGLFGHILEAGGRAIDPKTGIPLTPGVWTEGLWLNAGCATSLVTELHDGTEHGGMAAIVELEKDRVRYVFQTRPAP